MSQEFRSKLIIGLKKLLHFLLIALIIQAVALVMDWCLLNIALGCCKGGECWPDIYPDCRSHDHHSAGDDHGQQ